MYICPKCGTKIPDDASFCCNCGVKIVFPAAPVYEAIPVYEAQVQKGGNAFSVTSLVCGILSLMSMALPLITVLRLLGVAMSIIAIVFGVIGKKRRRCGMAKAGFILGIVGMGIYAFMFLITTGANSYDLFI